MDPCCNHGLCTKRAARGRSHCPEHLAICPWCNKEVEPVATDLDVAVFVHSNPRTDPRAAARNPWMCPECHGVGGGEDFFVGEDDHA